jgi:predicted pyridoxine 5'-phosphate oxidase superfamily flavin-nucleotide-binding protein
MSTSSAPDSVSAISGRPASASARPAASAHSVASAQPAAFTAARPAALEFASDVAFTATVKGIQTERGSRRSYERMERSMGGFPREISPELAGYIAERDSAYLATANAAGQPYVQHRGGPAGFIKVLDPRTLAFADFTGNRQYITTGNLAENERAFLFLMNYADGERIKIWGRARVVTNDAVLFERLADPTYRARVEQAIVFDVEAWNANCPQHIPRLVHVEKVEAAVSALRSRNAYLESLLRAAGVPFEPSNFQ